MLLVTLALVGRCRGKDHVIGCSTTYGEFFSRTPAPRGDRYVGSGAVRKGGHSQNSSASHRDRSIDTESVYSDLDRHALRTPTFGIKRGKTAPIAVTIASAEWHEMGRVSPSKLSFNKREDRYSIALSEEIDISSLERATDPSTEARLVPVSLA
jgi:hypothetical protein